MLTSQHDKFNMNYAFIPKALIPRLIFQAKWRNITEHAQKKFILFLAKYFASLVSLSHWRNRKAKPIRMQKKKLQTMQKNR